VKKNKDAYHIVLIYGQYFVVPTRFFQENLSQCTKPTSNYNDLDFQLLKTQFYYNDKVIQPKAYAPKKTDFTRLVDETNQLIYLRENLDLGLGMPLDYRRKIRISLEKERQYRKQIRANIKEIKRQVNASAT